jgi:N-acetylglucosaminyldiphosphoundecaprenol N-acetyl-beta-D-mannosaminyltransferase
MIVLKRLGSDVLNQVVLKTQVSVVTYSDVLAKVFDWIRSKQSKYISVANVHMVMESFDSKNFCSIVNDSDLVVPDGMPLVWMLRAMGHKAQTRVYGPELMLKLCGAASENEVSIGLFGSSTKTLADLEQALSTQFPSLNITFRHSPPFRELTLQEEAEIVADIKKSKAQILFVGLGCPKQEAWMSRHKGQVDVVMVGVGAAFDFHAGSIRQAPHWLQNLGLEWFFRLLIEPKRLWRRYVIHNPRFVVLALWQLVKFHIKRETK